MGFHPYCVVPGDRSPGDGLGGLDGAPVRAFRVDALAIWASELEAAPAPSVASLREHDAVIRSAAGSLGAGPLPVRFGGWVDSRRTLERRVRDRYEAYRRALEHLGDAREYGLRILDPEVEPDGEEGGPSTGTARSGTEYMERLVRRHAGRKRRDRRADEVLRALRDTVGATAADERVERPSGSSALLSVAHLVRSGDTEAYRERVGRFRSDNPRLRAVSTGPWAAYSFSP